VAAHADGWEVRDGSVRSRVTKQSSDPISCQDDFEGRTAVPPPHSRGARPST
jgi:hypothetical protein